MNGRRPRIAIGAGIIIALAVATIAVPSARVSVPVASAGGTCIADTSTGGLNALFAGTLEVVALWLKSIGAERLFYVYVAVVIGMAGVATILLPETRERSLITED